MDKNGNRTGVADMLEFSTKHEYIAGARSFFSPAMRNGVLQGARSNGDIVRFEPSTGYFGIMRSGKISTFFKPNGNEYERYEYFLKNLEN
jgi:hypothetical protein